MKLKLNHVRDALNNLHPETSINLNDYIDNIHSKQKWIDI